MKDNKLIELAARAVGPKVVRKVECSTGHQQNSRLRVAFLCLLLSSGHDFANIHTR